MYISKLQFQKSIFIEHITEAGFLLNEYGSGFLNDSLSWIENREEVYRLIAHVDGLELGEEIARNSMLECLDSDDEDELLGAMFCLASIAVDDTGLFLIIDAYSKEVDDEKLLLYVLAFKFAKHPKLTKNLLPLLQHENPLIRAATAEILGYRGDADPRRIWPLFHDEDDSVKISAMVAVMRLGFKEAVPAMEQAVLQSKESFNEHCILPLLMLGSKKALQFVQLVMRSPDFIKPQYPIYLAFAGNQQDYPLFMNALKYDDMLMPVVEALGIYGSVQAVEFLLQQLQADDDELKFEAAKSLNMITGANLKETAIIVEQEEPDLDVDEVIGQAEENKEERQGDSREVEIQQHCTDYQIWLNWWQNNKGRFDPNQRYRFGKPYSFFLVLEEIAKPDTVYNDRQRAYYELVIRSGEHIPFEPDWFVDKQIEALKKWQNWWNQNKTSLTNPWMFNGM